MALQAKSWLSENVNPLYSKPGSLTSETLLSDQTGGIKHVIPRSVRL